MPIIAAAIAAGTWPQQVGRRPTLLRIGCATTESDWLALWLTDQQVQLKTERFANPNYPLRSNLGVRINDFAQRNAQRKADLICDLAHCQHWLMM